MNYEYPTDDFRSDYGVLKNLSSVTSDGEKMAALKAFLAKKYPRPEELDAKALLVSLMADYVSKTPISFAHLATSAGQHNFRQDTGAAYSLRDRLGSASFSTPTLIALENEARKIEAQAGKNPA